MTGINAVAGSINDLDDHDVIGKSKISFSILFLKYLNQNVILECVTSCQTIKSHTLKLTTS